MVRHKSAGELKPNDQFLMAGGHYLILDIYDTDDTDMIKFTFVSVGSRFTTGRRLTMILERSILFVTA